MTPKEREIAFQHWQTLILRETRDLASLERVGQRALHDRDVCADTILQSRIRADLVQRRAEIERERRDREAPRAAPSTRTTQRPTASPGRQPPSAVSGALTAGPRPEPPAPPSPQPVPHQAALDQLTRAFSDGLARRAGREVQAVLDQMRALQAQGNGGLPAAALQPYERLTTKLLVRLGEFEVQIATLVKQAVDAARTGDAQAAATLLRRLTAIAFTYPESLPSAQLDQVRAAIVRANEAHEDGLRMRKLVDRERAVAADIRRIAAAVQDFQRVVYASPEEGTAEFRRAEARYLRVLREVRVHDPDWLAEFILELADLLAEWRITPVAAGKQIDHFLERVRLSLKRIRAKMSDIDKQRSAS